VQWRLPVLEAGTPPQEALRVVFDERLHEILIAERHCRKNVMARPALEQQVDDAFIAFPRRPPDHLAFVQVSSAVHIGTGVEENPDALEISLRRGEMQRAGVVANVANVRIGAVLEEQPQRLGMANRQVQPGAAPATRSRARPASTFKSWRNETTSPAVHARRNSATFGARR